MKKKILIPVSMAAMFLCASWQAAETTVSPDRLFLADNEKSLFVTNRAGCELIKMSSDGQKMEKKVSFSSPVNATYYQKNVKPKPETDGKKGFVCKVCGYIYEGDELPDDFICPLCKHGAADFEPIG